MPQSNLSSATGLVFQKEAQIQALWAVYTAVQFAEGGFGLSEYKDVGTMPPVIGLAVLFGVWAFNLGHLSMILRCIAQNEVIKEELNRNLYIDDSEKPSILNIISPDKEFSISRWLGFPNLFGRGYFMSVFIHFFIDCCASLALLWRVDFSWLTRIGALLTRS